MTEESPVEVPRSLDPRQIWFTNLMLLGFEPTAQEHKNKIRFHKEMFVLINKKGMEVVIYYLFNRLDSSTATEEFRSCWPIYEKKEEAQFRKACSNWLTRISKEDPHAKIPRLSASILMSPGGDKFEQLLVRFTAYVLKVVCLRESRDEEKEVYLSSFLSSGLPTSANPHLLRRALHCHITRHTQKVVDRLHLNSDLQQRWRRFVDEYVKEFREMGKEKRELQEKLKEIPPPPSSSEGGGGGSSTGIDRELKEKIELVKGYWKSLEEFMSSTENDREIVEEVLTGKRYTIDAKDFDFQISDTILPLYEAKLREGTIGRTYEDGKLNLVSLVQLWNCALRVMNEKFTECDLPSFEEESKEVKQLLQTHRANLTSAKNLRVSLVKHQELLQTKIASLEEELHELREKGSQSGGVPVIANESTDTSHLDLQNQLYIPPIMLPSLGGLELLPPSPQKPRPLSPPEVKHLQDHLSHLSCLPNDPVSTPEAVHNIAMNVQKQSRHQLQSTLFPSSSSASSSTTPSKSSKSSSLLQRTNNQGDPSIKGTPTSSSNLPKPSKKSKLPIKKQIKRPHPPTTSSSSETINEKGGDSRKATPLRSTTQSSQIMPTTPRLMESMPVAHDILAQQIAAAVADGSLLAASTTSANSTCTTSPEHEIHSVSDPMSALGGEAFISCDKIPRTPVKVPTTHSDEAPTPVAEVSSSASSSNSMSTSDTPSSTSAPLALSHTLLPSPSAPLTPPHTLLPSPSAPLTPSHTLLPSPSAPFTPSHTLLPSPSPPLSSSSTSNSHQPSPRQGVSFTPRQSAPTASPALISFSPSLPLVSSPFTSPLVDLHHSLSADVKLSSPSLPLVPPPSSSPLYPTITDTKLPSPSKTQVSVDQLRFTPPSKGLISTGSLLSGASPLILQPSPLLQSSVHSLEPPSSLLCPEPFSRACEPLQSSRLDTASGTFDTTLLLPLQEEPDITATIDQQSTKEQSGTGTPVTYLSSLPSTDSPVQYSTSFSVDDGANKLSSSFLLSSKIPSSPPIMEDISFSDEVEDEEEEEERGVEGEDKEEEEEEGAGTSQYSPNTSGTRLDSKALLSLSSTRDYSSVTNGVPIAHEISSLAVDETTTISLSVSNLPSSTNNPASSHSPRHTTNSSSSSSSLGCHQQQSSPFSPENRVQLIDLSSPPPAPPPLLSERSDEREWRPLDISVDGSPTKHTQHTTPHTTQSFNYTLVDQHQLNKSGENGLFDDDDDSVLIPLSPHSDWSST